MGVILEEICCANREKNNDNEDFTSTLNHARNKQIPVDAIDSLKNNKLIPENEINESFQKIKITNKNIVSSLPINTQKIIRQQMGDPYTYYEILKQLGHGTFGKVFKVKHKITNSIRAMKVIPKNNLKYGFTDKDIIHEIRILKALEHPSIIKLYEFYIYEDNYYLINEYCTEGDLCEKIAKLKFFPEFIVKIIMIKIFNAVLYLNSKGVIHGDLKLENIMIDSYLNKGLNNLTHNTFLTSIMHDIREFKEDYLYDSFLKKVTSTINRNKLKRNDAIDLKQNKNILTEDQKKKKSSEAENKKKRLTKLRSNSFDIFKSNRKKFNLDNISDDNKDDENKNAITSRLKRAYTKNDHHRVDLKKMKIKNFEIKLIDFGCSKIFTKYKKNFADTIGTLVYCSPEILLNNYNEKVDIWACGVIMYVLLSGVFPFYGKSQEEITKKIIKGKFEFEDKYFKKISENCKDLIRKCFIYDKDKRISAKEALKHPFFTDEINVNNIFEDDIDKEIKNVLSSLKNLKRTNKLYQTVLTYLSHNFADKKQVSQLSKIFTRFDLNLDGKISKEELFKAYKEAGIQIENKQLQKIIDIIDFDGNGYIEYEEFLRVSLPKEQLFTENNLKTAFDLFDIDKNGTISMSEFKEILGVKKDNENNNDEILKELNKINKDYKGEINFEQFKNIILGI